MTTIKLSLKEQKILWAVLNQAQDIGLKSLGQLLKQLNETVKDMDDISIKHKNYLAQDWIKQTIEEYDIINGLKVKLCGDLE